MTPEHPFHHDIEAMAERAADVGLPFRKWPRILRDLWRDEQVPRRKRELAFINALGLIVVLLCLPLDYSNGLETFETGLVLRLGILAPAYVFGIYAALRGGWQVQRWWAIVPVVCFGTVATYLGTHSAERLLHEYIMGGALIVIVAAVVLPLRAATIAMMIGLSLAGMWSAWSALPPEAARGSVALLAYLSVLMLMSLVIPLRTGALKDRNFLYALRSRYMSGRLLAANEQLRELSDRDDLTDLPNRRYFERVFDSAFRAAASSGDDLAVMMIDVDRFKQFNDSHGHAAGDRALKQIAKELEKQFAPSGSTVARYGGEEFVVVVEQCTQEEALGLADRARRAVAQRPVVLDIAGRVSVTISIGVAMKNTAVLSASALIERADQALYAAKNAGRNLVRLARDDGGTEPPTIIEKRA